MPQQPRHRLPERATLAPPAPSLACSAYNSAATLAQIGGLSVCARSLCRSRLAVCRGGSSFEVLS